MKKILLIVSSLLVLFSNNAVADFQTGNTIYLGLIDWKRDTTNSPINAGVAYGYVVGVADSVSGILVCLPSNVTQSQITDITYNYLRDNPQVRQKDASTLVIAALKQAFPCKK